MRLYYEIALRSFRRATSYRSSYIAGTLTNAFFGVLRSFVFIALYGAGGVVAGLALLTFALRRWREGRTDRHLRAIEHRLARMEERLPRR